MCFPNSQPPSPHLHHKVGPEVPSSFVESPQPSLGDCSLAQVVPSCTATLADKKATLWASGSCQHLLPTPPPRPPSFSEGRTQPV